MFRDVYDFYDTRNSVNSLALKNIRDNLLQLTDLKFFATLCYCFDPVFLNIIENNYYLI